MLLGNSTGNEVWICRAHPVLQAVAHMNITKKKKKSILINALSWGYPGLVLAQYLSA